MRNTKNIASNTELKNIWVFLGMLFISEQFFLLWN